MYSLKGEPPFSVLDEDDAMKDSF